MAMRPRPALSRIALIALAVLGVFGADVRLHAQDRFLGREDIILLGLGLRVEPDHQVVPKDIATIVSTFLNAPTPVLGQVAPFAPDALVKGILRGPGVGNGVALTAAPNTPFNIPPLSVPGVYTLDEIRFESGGQVLMRGTPESVTIEVIEKLLVTQVTARALSAQEIRDKGIVFDTSNFQAYNFTAAFAVQDTPVQISFPIVLPTRQGAQDITLSGADLGSLVTVPRLPELKTLIPDTLRLQTQFPNLKVVGFTLSVATLRGQELIVPPIPGVVVIPADIGYLNQFFSVVLMVGNAAPAGSNLVVSDLTGEILLPAGNDTVVGSDDDPLRMAVTAAGPSPRINLVVRPGPDGKLGTADDIGMLAPGESGSSEYLVEGRREGTHVIEFSITGTLHGLPVGPVQVTGRAAGAVLVRNPTFTLAFTHPNTVTAGEHYTLDVTVINTSASPANFVSVNLFSQNVSGATVVGDPSRQIEAIPAGDAATISFELISRVTGKVTAATLDADGHVEGRFSLKTAVGELGVPLSPDSLILPAEANALPSDVRRAVLGLLGKAWAVATAPAAALPIDVKRLSKQIVFDRAVQAAEAGLRISLHEPVPDSVAQLEMDYIGSDIGRLASLHPNAADRPFVEADFIAFDELRRRSVRGDLLATVVGAHLAPEVATLGAIGFHRSFAEKTSYRPAQLSVLIAGDGGLLPFAATLVDAQGRRIGGQDSAGKVIKQIPYSDILPLTDGGGTLTGQLIVLAAPDAGGYHLQFEAVAGAQADAAFSVSLVTPDGAGGMRQVAYTGLHGNVGVQSPFTAADTYRVVLDLPVNNGVPQALMAAGLDVAIVAPAPHVLGVVQQAEKDVLSCTAIVGIEGIAETVSFATPVGRVIAVLFSEEVTPASVQDRLAANDIVNFTIEGNKVVGVALQPGGRVAYLALRDPVGPFIARQLTVSGVTNGRGRAMAAEAAPIEPTVTNDASVVSGQVIGADGQPIPFASVRLLISNPCGTLVGISSKSADDQGRFGWDWVANSGRNRIAAVTPGGDDARAIDFTSQRNGQRLNVNVVLLGRGTVQGRALAENGTPLARANVKITSLTDDSSYGATTDDTGTFIIPRIPVGNIFIEAVHSPSNARGSASDLIPLAGARVVRNLTLFSLTFPTITVRFGTATGHVLRTDGSAPAVNVPVVAYYQSGTQLGVACPPGLSECAVGVTHTDSAGRFVLEHISAGQIRLSTFDQLTFQQGDARVGLPADGTFDANIFLSKGLGTVNGTVLDASGGPVAGARVGGGLSLTTTDASGHFVLTDVPVGRQEIRAVSDALGTSGGSAIDLVQAGQVVNVTVVLQAIGTIAGTVYQADGVTPVPNISVYLFHSVGGDGAAAIDVVATATTDAGGHYTMDGVTLRPEGYGLSAFRSDFSDGNVKPVVLKFNNQVLRGDIVFRGGGGHVRGRVLDADGTTPLRAAVGVSGDAVVVAGGLVGTAFQNVTNHHIANSDFTTGAFGFDNIFVGPFTLAAAGQFSPDPITFEGRITAPGATTQVELRLQATSRIQGIVFQPDGATPVGRNVLVHYASTAFKLVCAGAGGLTIGNLRIEPATCAEVPQGIQDETVITDDSGRYLLPLVTAGAFTLTAEDPTSGKTAQVSGMIAPGHTGDFSIRLLGVSTLTINVRGSDSTTVIPNARVEVSQIAFPKKRFVGAADGNGTLVLGGGDAFAEGDFIVMATDLRNGFAGRASGRVTRDGDNVVVNVFLFNASGSVVGTVFRPDGFTPVPNAEVVISNCTLQPGYIGPEPVPCVSGGPLAFDVTDATGAYRQDLIPLGAFRVDVFEAATARRGFGSGRIDLDHQVVPVNIVEAARGLVTGTLYAAGSLAPLKNWEVSLDQRSQGGRSLPRLQTTTDVDGTFSFPGVTIGEFRLYVSRPSLQPGEPYGSAQSSGTVTNEGQHVDVPVIVTLVEQHFGIVEGIVVNPDGTPAANVSVDLCPIMTCVTGSLAGHLYTVTGADGGFAYDHVRTGRFIISAASQVSLNATRSEGELLFEGDIAQVTLILVGTSQVSGSVVFGNGAPAANIQVTLYGLPTSGCIDRSGCIGFTNGNGEFSFPNVTARTYDVRAVDPVSGLNGVITGVLNPGDHAVVRVVLQATASVSGRVLFADGRPAPAITAELRQTGVLTPIDIFQVTGVDGRFNFAAVPTSTFTLSLEDPIGPGVAHRSVQVAASVSLGDITLDDAAPRVATLVPAASAVGVPLSSVIRIVFSEPISAGTISQSNVRLTGSTSTVLGTLQVTDGDTTAVFTPLSPLSQQTRYTLSIQGVTDRVGKALQGTFTANFTTVDLTPPSVLEATPAANGNGVALASVIRIKYSEPVDPARFGGLPIVLTRGPTTVAGRTDFILGNTTVVFTPTIPLDENTLYQVQVGAAVDLAGNAQPQGVAYAFRSFDRTPPLVVGLTAAGDGTVIENGATTVVADVGDAHDISVVDFFINDQPSFAARTAPFVLNFQALAVLGSPGGQIKISALATDTSGNRGATRAVVFIPIVADGPPVVTITAPAAGAGLHTGDRVTVTVHVTDDLGATQVAYRAQTGQPQDASVQSIGPSSRDVTRTFAFSVPVNATPGSVLTIEASARDTKNQLTTAAPVSITVLDATPPSVTITGTTTGARVSPGQQTSAIVSAQDLGGIAALTFTTGGILAGTETRPVTPALNSVVTTFAFTVPATAHAGDTLTLDAIATDAAGNATSAARVLLPIADLHPPTLHLRTTTGNLTVVPGATVTVIADGDDETGINTVTLAGQGAFTVNQARQVSPVSNSIQLPFQIPVPAGVVDGSVLNLSATAADIFGNVSAPATLALTVRSGVGVTLPLSLLVAAGETVPLAIELATPAPVGGLRVDLTAANGLVLQVMPSVQFAEGQTVAQATVSGVVGGSTSVSAFIAGVLRAGTTVTVRGGVVSGTVFNPQLQPIAGATVIVIGGAGGVPSTVTDGSGAYVVEGVGGTQFPSTGFSVRVTDPVTNQIGFATGTLSAPGGFAHLNVVVVTAGSIGGTVSTADGVTPAAAGARVDLFASTNLYQPLATIFASDGGIFEFPLVSLGTFVVEASDVQGNRGRSVPLALTASGQHLDTSVSYIGRGSVIGTVRDGGNNAAANVPITLTSTSLFGQAPIIVANTAQDGTFRFDGVFVGSFTVQARDPATNLAGTVSGAVNSNLQLVTADIRLAQWGGLQGTVFRADGVTPLVGGSVQVSAGVASLTTETDSAGHYAFGFLPLGPFSVSVSEPATRGIGRATGTLAVQAQVVTQNVTLFPQGTLVITVTDANGALVPGAVVRVSSNNNLAGDSIETSTGQNGIVVVEHVLASQSVTVLGLANSLTGYVQTTLQANEVKPVTIQLQPTGSITGTVFRPDGQTPASDARVGLFGTLLQVNADGTFRFDNLTLRAYEVAAYDGQGRKRALATNIVLNQNGQIATVNLTFVGIGSVIGRVLNPNSSSAPNLDVQVRSLDPQFGGFQFPRTDAAGYYRADNVVVGAIVVSAGDASRGLLGEATGTLAHDGDTITLDILLRNNAITLPVTKSDANFFPFDVQRDASIANGLNGSYTGSSYTGQPGGGFFLDLVASGTANRFTGSAIGTTEDNGREIVVSQNNLAGLNVTRKVLVSPSYFARYLEILANPTVAPITVDVSVQSKPRSGILATTSTGDATLSVTDPASPDRWVVLNMGQDVDPFRQFGPAHLAFAFDGAGATRGASAATFDADPNSSFRALTYRWNNVTLQPGQTMAFMHFGVQQYSRAAAEASVARLATLPPEALESLSAEEIAEIQNFAVPAGGTSAVAPLPPLGGMITGRLFEADRTTPVSFLNLRYRSNLLLFGRTYFSFTATSSFTIGGAGVTVPLDAFTIEADHPVTQVTSPAAVGTFPSGLTTATADIVFSNTGIVRGTVRRTSGVPVAGANLVATSSADYGRSYPVTASDGSYFAGGIVPGSVTVVASIRHPQGLYTGAFSLKGNAVVTLAAGASVVRDLTIEPTGIVAGTVRTALGAPAVNTTVELRGIDPTSTFVYLQTQTDSAGGYRFNDAPLGVLTVKANLLGTYFSVSGQVTVLRDQTSTRDLTLLALGTVSLTVTYTNGLPASGAYVEIQEAALDQYFRSAPSATDVNGRLTITDVPEGAFVVRVHRPGADYYTTVDVPGRLTSQGQVVPLAAVLPPVGTVVIQVNSLAGTPVANARVDGDVYYPGSAQNLGTTDQNGRVTLTSVRGPAPFFVRAFDPQTGQFRQATGALTAEGQTLAITVTLGTTGSISGRITKANGSPAADVTAVVLALGGNVGVAVTTDGNGDYHVSGIPTGVFRIRVFDYPHQRFGSFEGELVHNGDAVVGDFAVSDALISSPGYNLADANGFNYLVRTDGSISGTGITDGFFGFPSLYVSPTGTSASQRFVGDYGAAFEQNGRQLVVPNFDNQGIEPQLLSGLTVTRKVYVDPAGYFGRYLEVFDNPTTSPITVDVQVLGTLNANRIAATSSGDATLTADDRWFVTEYVPAQTRPRDTVVFGGANAALAPSAAALNAGSVNGPTQVAWNGLTVPAGGRAILMHFVSSEPDAAAAVAVAERLAQAPPEALVGLTAADFAAIVNFAVLADGSSTAPPFGIVTGRVLAGLVPVPNAVVLIGGSSAPIFRPAITVQADANGQYVAATLGVGPFTVQARDVVTGDLTPVVSLSLGVGETSITQDLVFANVGVLRGTIRFGTGNPVSGGQVSITGGVPPVNLVVPIATDGTYSSGGLRAGTYALSATADGRSGLRAGNLVTVGDTTVADVTLRALARLRITLRRSGGAPFVGAFLYVTDHRGIQYSAQTDATGTATFFSLIDEGPFSVLLSGVNETFAGAILPAQDGQTVDFAFVSTAGSLTGTVRLADGTPVSGNRFADYVQISADGGLNTIASSAIAADGTYAIDAVRPGTYVGFATVAGHTTRSAPFVVAAGQHVVFDIRAPAIATLRVTVQPAGGAPVAGAYVYLGDGITLLRYGGTTDANGVVVIPAVAEGPFTVTVYAYGGVRLNISRAGVIAAADNGQVVNVLVAPVVGSVSGHVYVADGVTPASGVQVDFIDLVSNATVSGATTDDFGAYAIPTVGTDGGGFRVRVHSPSNYALVVEATGSFASMPSVVIDLTLPVGVVRGTVFDANGAPAALATLLLAQETPGGDVITVSRTTDGVGTFTVVGVSGGGFEVLALNAMGTVSGRARGTVPDVMVAVTADVTLGPSGTVTGIVRDAAGNPAAFVDVALASDDAAVGPQYAAADASGLFTFAEVPVRSFSVEACQYTQSLLCAASAGEVATAGQTVTMDISLGTTGTVFGTVFAADGTSPVPNAYVYIAAGADGPRGIYQTSLYADANGHYAQTGVPPGPLGVVVFDPGTFALLGGTPGTLAPGGSLLLDVRGGTALLACDQSLSGADTFQYDPGCVGELRRGGTADGRLNGAYNQDAYKLRVNGSRGSPGTTVARSELTGRQVVYGPIGLSGVEATRKVFVPASGGFARFLDTITNPSAVSVTLTVQSAGSLGGAVHTLVDPGATGNTYAVTLADPSQNGTGESGPATPPALAHVFAGPGADTAASNVAFQSLIGPSSYEWRVTIPAGESVTLMHFAVQREPTDAAGAEAQALALVNLTDPNALAGMTAEERSRVVNFRIQ